jgi:hypothetical protein
MKGSRLVALLSRLLLQVTGDRGRLTVDHHTSAVPAPMR